MSSLCPSLSLDKENTDQPSAQDRGMIHPNLTLDGENTISTIHSSDPLQDDSFQVITNDGKNEKEAPESKAPKRKKSVLHTYPENQSTATAASRKLIKSLKEIYKNDVLPIEQKFGLYNFCLPTNAEIKDSEFDAKPMVLLMGQYSTGKTTFIRHLVGRDFPAMHIGPEPTTDRFTALVHGLSEEDEEEIESDDEYSTTGSVKNSKAPTKAWKKDGRNKSNGKVLKGNSLTVMPELPFSTLATFGSGFLSHFVGSVSSAPLLEHVTLIDTPGVLSGEKQRLSRSYDFAEAAKWFADRSDLILLLFDAHKLDISDELKDVIETIRPNNDDKMRCILNKADAVTREQLVRVYGSLLWSMGKIFHSPEVVRVFTGSYWDEELVHDDFQSMFDSDEWLLINELVNLPKSCAERKVNEVVKRIRIIKVHVCILSYLKKNMPSWFGKKKAMEKMIENLVGVFDAVRIEYKLSAGDFPDIEEFADCLRDVDDFSDFIIADKKTLRILDNLITTDIPNIMKCASGLSGPDTPVRKKKSQVVKETENDTLSSLNESEKEGIQFIDLTDLVVTKGKTMNSYLIMGLANFMGVYMLMYFLINFKSIQLSFPLPLMIIKHFIKVHEFIRANIFDDTIVSGDLIV